MQRGTACWWQEQIWKQQIFHVSDYDTFYIASKEETMQQIQTAEQILHLAEKYLEETE